MKNKIFFAVTSLFLVIPFISCSKGETKKYSDDIHGDYKKYGFNYLNKECLFVAEGERELESHEVVEVLQTFINTQKSKIKRLSVGNHYNTKEDQYKLTTDTIKVIRLYSNAIESFEREKYVGPDGKRITENWKPNLCLVDNNYATTYTYEEDSFYRMFSNPYFNSQDFINHFQKELVAPMVEPTSLFHDDDLFISLYSDYTEMQYFKTADGYLFLQNLVMDDGGEKMTTQEGLVFDEECRLIKYGIRYFSYVGENYYLTTNTTVFDYFESTREELDTSKVEEKLAKYTSIYSCDVFSYLAPYSGETISKDSFTSTLSNSFEWNYSFVRNSGYIETTVEITSESTLKAILEKFDLIIYDNTRTDILHQTISFGVEHCADNVVYSNCSEGDLFVYYPEGETRTLTIKMFAGFLFSGSGQLIIDSRVGKGSITASYK